MRWLFLACIIFAVVVAFASAVVAMGVCERAGLPDWIGDLIATVVFVAVLVLMHAGIDALFPDQKRRRR